MTATTLTIFSLLTLIFMLVGGIIGYMIHTHQSNKLSMHPEMYDGEGNLVDDDLFYLRYSEEDDTITDKDD